MKKNKHNNLTEAESPGSVAATPDHGNVTGWNETPQQLLGGWDERWTYGRELSRAVFKRERSSIRAACKRERCDDGNRI
ncbi:hypothetical protein LFX17_20350 [Leptospira sp. FAT1]|nr:hypothetical protein [Leptospira sanjuanensis]MCG6170196.1 hypothetical protein [Leptospira sanjuanensis]